MTDGSLLYGQNCYVGKDILSGNPGTRNQSLKAGSWQNECVDVYPQTLEASHTLCLMPTTLLWGGVYTSNQSEGLAWLEHHMRWWQAWSHDLAWGWGAPGWVGWWWSWSQGVDHLFTGGSHGELWYIISQERGSLSAIPRYPLPPTLLPADHRPDTVEEPSQDVKYAKITQGRNLFVINDISW